MELGAWGEDARRKPGDWARPARVWMTWQSL